MENRHTALYDLLHFLQGALIGAGAILPGISGGVLAVVFGIYRPLMEVLAAPRSGVRRYRRLFIPVLLGWAVGFFCGAGLIVLIFGSNEVLATWLFIGLIAGTLPALWRKVSQQGHSRRAYAAMLLAFAVLFAALYFASHTSLFTVSPGIGAFLFCGILWGLSFIVPGMTSSSILMSLDLFQPLNGGILALDPAVLLPWLAGMAVTVALLSRLVTYLLRAHYSVTSHATFGVVLASTLVILPTHYADTRELLLSLAVCAAGFLAAYFSSRGEGRA